MVTASQMANVVSKAFNREIICLEHDNSFKFFLSEKDKNHHLSAPADDSFKPAATLLKVDGTDGWWINYQDFEGTTHSSTNGIEIYEALYLLVVKWFSARFVADSFQDFKNQG